MYVCVCLADKDAASLAALDITDESHLFLWDGVQVGGEDIPVGEGCEPMQLSVTYPSLDARRGQRKGEAAETEMVMAFNKSATLREVKVCMGCCNVSIYYDNVAIQCKAFILYSEVFMPFSCSKLSAPPLLGD